MEQEINSLLQGITPAEFKLMYLVGVSGFVLRFLFNLGYGIWWDPNTPNRPHFRSFIKGFARIIVSLAVMALVVARFADFSHYLVDIEFTVPTRLAEGNDVVAKITFISALGTGLALDDVVKRFMGKGEKIIKNKKKLK